MRYNVRGCCSVPVGFRNDPNNDFFRTRGGAFFARLESFKRAVMNKKKVLVVDDDPACLELVKALLEKTGDYEVRVEQDSINVQKIAKKFKPAVILLDVLMPKMNGFKVLENLKGDLSTVSIPVIMLSSLSSEEEKLRAAALYNDAYLEKPVNGHLLTQKVAEVLKRSGL